MVRLLATAPRLQLFVQFVVYYHCSGWRCILVTSNVDVLIKVLILSCILVMKWTDVDKLHLYTEVKLVMTNACSHLWNKQTKNPVMSILWKILIVAEIHIQSWRPKILLMFMLGKLLPMLSSVFWAQHLDYTHYLITHQRLSYFSSVEVSKIIFF